MSDSLGLPRILCLHGVGSNADVLFLQTRMLREQLSSSFRFVFANGPFFCDPGPGVLPVYAGAEPFRRWLRWSPKHRIMKPPVHIEAIRRSLEDSMLEDDQAGATGPWIGLLGFSQGARFSASILYESQRRQAVRSSGGSVCGYEGEDVDTLLWRQDWKFAVFFSGPAPLVALAPGLEHLPLQSPTERDLAHLELDKLDPTGKVLIERPTLHVIGVQDEWAPRQMRLYEKYCATDTKALIEWEGDHRIPIDPQEIEPIVKRMLSMAA